MSVVESSRALSVGGPLSPAPPNDEPPMMKREGPNWYEQALEVVIETCNWVLEQPDRDQLYMHWSG